MIPLVRIVLALVNAFSTIYLARCLEIRTRKSTLAKTTESTPVATFYLLLSLTQFHTLFYASRPLPNFFALPLVNVSYGLLVLAPSTTPSVSTEPSPNRSTVNRACLALAILSWTASIVRSEIALLLLPLAFTLLVTRKISFTGGLLSGMIGGLSGATLSYFVDSYFWNQPTWPEWDAIMFNVYHGHSSNWGTSPWWTYLVVFLPKLLLSSLPLSVFALVGSKRSRRILSSMGVRTWGLAAIIGLVGGLSCLGHKEWRFVVYVVPIINLYAAVGLATLWTTIRSSKANVAVAPPPPPPSSTSTSTSSTTRSLEWGKFLAFGIIMSSLTINVVVTLVLVFISCQNYPGGQAMSQLHNHIASSQNGTTDSHVRLFIPPAVLQTGASRYTFTHQLDESVHWEYNRTESPLLTTPLQLWSERFDYTFTDNLASFFNETLVITSHDQGFVPPSRVKEMWEVVRGVQSFGGVEMSERRLPRIIWKDKIWILKRRG